jgi:hypothetical protein
MKIELETTVGINMSLDTFNAHIAAARAEERAKVMKELDEMTAKRDVCARTFEKMKLYATQMEDAARTARAEERAKVMKEVSETPVVGLLHHGVAISMCGYNSITDEYVKSCWNGALTLIVKPNI